ncbi:MULTISPECIES: Abi family protein [unclassified Sphaerospermopsis]|uniref:Abi family protein n=1 Tax=unclassified Sphaerospermopsis TaxID=2646443 RepID=UPI001680D27D|nr:MULTISPECIES: Abi family protein [unclassified Sphaerospermopsis]MBD2135237.1 Abi family protein [Sphaerospermopsis sp. FACHB-1094]MBD2147889.1 Abi family protein [Sphaerospermopsis sp. FACHB-1194]
MINQPSLIRPNLPKPKLDNLDFFQKAFSNARIGKYFECVSSSKKTTDQDIKNAIRLYEINMIYCESLYPSLHTLEIALRNYIDINLINKYNLNWFICDTDSFDNAIYKIENKYNLNIILPNIEKNHTTILLKHEEEKIISAIEDTIKTSNEKSNKQYRENQDFIITVNRDKIITNLSLGFWTTLLTQNKREDNNYFNKIFIPCIKSIFPYAKNNERTCSTVVPLLTGIKDLRNRVFHHEPIWNYDNLKQRYDNIYKVINWIDPNLEIWLRQDSKIDRFPEIYQSLSEEVQLLTQKNKTTKIQYEDRSYAS